MKSFRLVTLPVLIVCSFACLLPAHAGLEEIETKYRHIYELRVKNKYDQSLATLQKKYSSALTQTLHKATKNGDLESAVAFRTEIQRLKDGSALPDNEQETCIDLAKLRSAYNERLDKLKAAKYQAEFPIFTQFSKALIAYQNQLTKAGKLDEAMAVKAYMDGNPAERVFGEQAGMEIATRPALPRIWLGHCIETEPEIISHFVKEANCVLDQGWPKYDDELIKEAREKGVHVILVFTTENVSKARRKGIELAEENPDVVVAMCWESPYYDKATPNDLSQFAKELKEAVPGIQFWGQFVEKPRGKLQTLSIPPEVDIVVVASYFVENGPKMEAKANKALPGWMEKAEGRPVLLYWCPWTKQPPGLVMQCSPGTMKACASAARKYDLSGLILGHYGERWKHAGIEERPQLQEEIEDVARKLF